MGGGKKYEEFSFVTKFYEFILKICLDLRQRGEEDELDFLVKTLDRELLLKIKVKGCGVIYATKPLQNKTESFIKIV